MILGQGLKGVPDVIASVGFQRHVRRFSPERAAPESHPLHMISGSVEGFRPQGWNRAVSPKGGGGMSDRNVEHSCLSMPIWTRFMQTYLALL